MLKTNSLTPDVFNVVINKETEPAFSGRYANSNELGTYVCRHCGRALFRSEDQFHASCGWPSFDEIIPGTVKTEPDSDGRRTEILCSNCDAHLGHVFHGENHTVKNTRHCVNSLSLDFVLDSEVQTTEEAILAAGCFWGVEYCFKRLPGVVKTEVGYTGGHQDHPSYEAVCWGHTGHFEAIRVLYNPEKINYEDILNYFYKIHNPLQADGQGPDIGQQYLSAIFYHDDIQKKVAEKTLMAAQAEFGGVLRTRLLPAQIFWPAEEYHQDYYTKTGKAPYCHYLP